MKLNELMTTVNGNADVIVKDKATNEIVQVPDSAAYVVEISTESDNITAYVDITNYRYVMTEYEKSVVDAWEKIFGDCNDWGFDTSDYEWEMYGLDVYGNRVTFATKAELISAMETDVKETLYCEFRNGTLSEFIANCEL